MSDPYSPLKVFWHRSHVDAIREGRVVAPVHVQLIPTNVCNQSCEFCAYRSHGYSSSQQFDTRDSIPFPKLAEIVADCEDMGVRAVEVTGGGEPTCHKNFPQVCMMVVDGGMDLGVVTNGTRWAQDCVTATQHAKWVRFSLDAGSAETYAATRRSTKEAYTNVRAAIRQQRESRVEKDQLVGVGFVMTRNNFQEVVEATERARDDGADTIRISAVFQDEGIRYFYDFRDHAERLVQEARSLDDGQFRVFDMFSHRLKDLEEARPNYHRCDFQKLCTYVGADLNLYRCCVVSYNEAGRLISLADRPLQEAWFDPAVQKKLLEFDPAACPRCMFNAKNRAIAFAAEKDPQHVNFL